MEKSQTSCAMCASTSDAAPPALLTLGVMTNPSLGTWRNLVRKVMYKPLSSLNGSISVRFVIGGRLHQCREQVAAKLGCPNRTVAPLMCTKLSRELIAYSDLWVLTYARECGARKEAVAEKAFEWYREASSLQGGVNSRWIGKLDDDTFPNLWLLAHDVRQMDVTLRTKQGGERTRDVYAYYGVMGWRVWSHRHRHACFGPVVGIRAGPNGGTRWGLWNIYRAIASAWNATKADSHKVKDVDDAAGHCDSKSHSGPYPYADGMLNIMSAPLARAVFSSAAANELARGAWRDGAAHPLAEHDWNHEDVGIGYLVFAVSASDAIHTSYFALQREHERVYSSAAKQLRSSLMATPSDAEVQRHSRHPKVKADVACTVTVAHDVRRARLLLDTEHTFRVRELHRAKHDVPYPYSFVCGDCANTWSWDRATAAGGQAVQPSRGFVCCHKHGGAKNRSAC